VRLIGLSGGTRLHRAAYAELEADVAALVHRFWNNRAAEIRLHRRWMTNLYRNIRLPGRPVDHLRSTLPPRAVLVGAGPSLDEALPLLREFFPAERPDSGNIVPNPPGSAAEATHVLLAIDTALPALAAAGVRPDLILAMDGQLANAADFLPWRWDRCNVVVDASTHFSIPRRVAPDRLFWFVSRFSETGIFRDQSMTGIFDGVPIIPPRGSVAPAAVQIAAEHLGITEISCIGIDFWYRLPRSHATMSSPDRRARRSGDRLHHRDGHDRSLARPWVAVTLRDCTTTRGDAVLVEQARLMAEVIRSLTVPVFVIGDQGIDVGGAACDLVQLRRSLASAGDSGAVGTSEGAPPSGGGAVGTSEGARPLGDGGSAASSKSAPPLGDQRHAALTRRTAAVAHLRERLIRQEAILADPQRPLFLDSGLDFVVADLPQWPLMMLRREWVELHRPRILRAVRDYRRRLDASILG
jgi:hypothetical protein